MLRALSLAMIILVFPVALAPADEGPNQEGNAALKYWQAFATLPKFTPAENQIIGEFLTTPLDEPTRKMLTHAEYSLQMLHRAAALRRCDWSISYADDGVFARLPHADASRAIAFLACLRSRVRFEAGQNAEAIDDLLAAMTLGRHITLDRCLVTLLIAYRIDQGTIETLARYMPKLDAKTMTDLKSRMDALPPFGSQGAALLACEKESMDWFIRKIKETKDQDSLLAFLSWIGISEGTGPDSGEKARDFLKECGGNAKSMIKFANELLPCYATTAKMLELPLDEFEKEFKRESVKQAGNPVYKMFFPPLAKVREARARADIRRALLSAAIAVQKDGQGALKAHPDPVVGGPFEYSSFKGGFELRSKLKMQDDKHLSLTVGQRG
jgi:hypothetical protein